jgi:hypothetical protein
VRTVSETPSGVEWRSDTEEPLHRALAQLADDVGVLGRSQRLSEQLEHRRYALSDQAVVNLTERNEVVFNIIAERRAGNKVVHVNWTASGGVMPRSSHRLAM